MWVYPVFILLAPIIVSAIMTFIITAEHRWTEAYSHFSPLQKVRFYLKYYAIVLSILLIFVALVLFILQFFKDFAHIKRIFRW